MDLCSALQGHGESGPSLYIAKGRRLGLHFTRISPLLLRLASSFRLEEIKVKQIPPSVFSEKDHNELVNIPVPWLNVIHVRPRQGLQDHAMSSRHARSLQ